MTQTTLPPIHPGEILLEEFLTPMGISQYRLSREIDLPQRRIGEIVAPVFFPLTMEKRLRKHH